MASVSAAVSSARHPAQHDRHQQRRGLIVGQAAVGHAGDEEVDGGAVERAAVPLLPYEIDRAH